MENHASLKGQIVNLALEKFNHECFPTKSGYKESRAYRVPDDNDPLGFDFYGISIEVHVQYVQDVLVPGTKKVFQPVPVLLILGLRDNQTSIISEGVLAQ